MQQEQPDWDPRFSARSPIFEPLRDLARRFRRFHDWPGLSDLRELFEAAELPVRPVPQDGKPGEFSSHYEPRIYLKGELQTRTGNWHDFFNALVWLKFPLAKQELNRLHYEAASARAAGTNRSRIENDLTRFDECGAVLVSADPDLLELVREHRWKDLFVTERSRFQANVRCFVFGHASFEKALTPYVGMTTNTLLIHEPALLGAPWSDLDAHMAMLWAGADEGRAPCLHPFPLLGVPGWFAANADPRFYDDERYFRAKRPRA
ncbi:MAG: DUF3025 domain-containing protein [Gammaproteobacteria bacterium]